MRRLPLGCVLAPHLAPLLLGACAAPSASAPKLASDPAARLEPPTSASCARRGSAPLPSRASQARQGSAVALVRSGGQLLAYVADGDSRSIHTVSIDNRRELGHTRLAGAPRQLLVLDDGRVAATLSDGARVAVLEPGADPASPLAVLCEREVPAEPWGIAASPGDAKIVVASAWGAALTVLDGATFARQRVVALPRDPRSVLVDDAGVAFVSHLVGAKMSAVDLAHPEAAPEAIDLGVHKHAARAELADMRAVRTGSQGYALASVPFEHTLRILAPMTSVDPGDIERRSSAYYGPPFDGVPKEAPIVSVVDPARRRPLDASLIATSEQQVARECLLPRAAAVVRSTGALLVACRGLDAVLELDALALDPMRAERRRFAVQPGPEGIAVDDASGRAVVFSQFAGSLTVIDPAVEGDAARATIALDYRPTPEVAATQLGRQLFYRTDDARITADGLACSSCHPDGREDGITWRTPFGPRQTLMLAGRLHGTEPYGWDGERATLVDYIGNTVSRLGGNGLGKPEVEELSAFLVATPSPPGPPGAAATGEMIAHGRALFESSDQGCVSCHLAGTGTDAQTHELPGSASGDSVRAFDTPSLLFVRGTAPYFHDGRYATLEALLADPFSGMGRSASLSSADRAALAAYLRSL
jgi:DNA-binding beta-propeller fold protein YncE